MFARPDKLTFVDPTEIDFETVVINRSHSLSVVVDLWAEWCAPARNWV